MNKMKCLRAAVKGFRHAPIGWNSNFSNEVVSRMKRTTKAIKRKWWKNQPSGKFHQFTDGDIVCSDALVFLSNLRENCADIVFLDPPFNLGKHYGRNGSTKDQVQDSKYHEFIENIILRSIEILKDGGALYLYHIPRWAIRFAGILEKNMQFRHWIAISMKNGFVRGNRLYPAHYALLYFTKGKPMTFSRPKIPVPTCRHCRNYIKDYGGYKRYVENGLNLSDIWDDISPVRHKRYKNRIANELPIEIPRRVIQISGKRGAILVDPFAGSGTSLLAARERKMRFIACDNQLEYFNLIKKRISNSDNSTTKTGIKRWLSNETSL